MTNIKPHSIILKFYLMYIGLCILGNFFIDYNHLSLLTISIVTIYISLLFFGAFAGYHNTSCKNNFLWIVKIKNIILVLSIVLTLSVFYSWYLNITYYGSLEYIILNSFTIRTNSIGGEVSIFPTYLTYTNSLVYAAFILSLVYYELSQKRKYIFFAVYFFVLIILCDLLLFGRIGILYGIFSFLGYLIVYGKLKFNIRNILLILLLFLILILPRLIRGSFDNMESSMNNYLPYFIVEIPNYLYSFVSVYIYYFSSIYAFDFYINESEQTLTYGFRMFTPFAHIIANIMGLERLNTIDVMANVPFEYNIYTVLKDIYSDYSIIGIIFLPFIIGFFFGFIFKKQTIQYNAIKAYSLGWLFYTPIFNAFSFGGFLISFLFLFILTFTKEDYYEKG